MFGAATERHRRGGDGAGVGRVLGRLQQRFGVGRPAVRWAMQSLGAMGGVTIAQGWRAKAGPLSPASAIQPVDPDARLLVSNSADNLAHLKQARRLCQLSMVRIAAGVARLAAARLDGGARRGGAKNRLALRRADVEPFFGLAARLGQIMPIDRATPNS
jgi:hypothetical protein